MKLVPGCSAAPARVWSGRLAGGGEATLVPVFVLLYVCPSLPPATSAPLMTFWSDADSCEITGPMSSLTSTTASLSRQRWAVGGVTLRLPACWVGGGGGGVGGGGLGREAGGWRGREGVGVRAGPGEVPGMGRRSSPSRDAGIK